MLVLDQINKGDGSLRLVAWWISAGLLVLAAGLWRIQVLQGEHYRERQETQSFRSVRVPALRGRILDRNGLPLVDNQPRYRLDVYLDELLPQFAAEGAKAPGRGGNHEGQGSFVPQRRFRSGCGDVRLQHGSC